MPLKANRLSYECSCGYKGSVELDTYLNLNLTYLRERIEEQHGGHGNMLVLLAVELEWNKAPWVTCAVRHIQ